jgi:hypothetical protein
MQLCLANTIENISSISSARRVQQEMLQSVEAVYDKIQKLTQAKTWSGKFRKLDAYEMEYLLLKFHQVLYIEPFDLYKYMLMSGFVQIRRSPELPSQDWLETVASHAWTVIPSVSGINEEITHIVLTQDEYECYTFFRELKDCSFSVNHDKIYKFLEWRNSK